MKMQTRFSKEPEPWIELYEPIKHLLVPCGTSVCMKHLLPAPILGEYLQDLCCYPTSYETNLVRTGVAVTNAIKLEGLRTLIYLGVRQSHREPSSLY